LATIQKLKENMYEQTRPKSYVKITIAAAMIMIIVDIMNVIPMAISFSAIIKKHSSHRDSCRNHCTATARSTHLLLLQLCGSAGPGLWLCFCLQCQCVRWEHKGSARSPRECECESACSRTGQTRCFRYIKLAGGPGGRC
jgi:hypothetical protein